MPDLDSVRVNPPDQEDVDMDIVTEEADYYSSEEEGELADMLTQVLRDTLLSPRTENIESLAIMINSEETPSNEGLYVNAGEYLRATPITRLSEACSVETIIESERVINQMVETYEVMVAANRYQPRMDRIYFKQGNKIVIESNINDRVVQGTSSRTFNVTAEVMGCIMHNAMDGRVQFYTINGMRVFDYRPINIR